MLLYSKMICFLVGELVLFFLYGKATAFCLKLDKQPVAYLILIGYFISNLIFFLLDIPMKALQAPLSVLSTVWVLTNVVLVVFHILFWKKIQIFQKNSPFPWKRVVVTGIFLSLIAVGMLGFVWGNGANGSPWDSYYYIGDITGSVYTNTISCFNAYTGEKLDYLSVEYFFETLENRDAVISQIFSIHPLITAKYIQSGITLCLYLCVIFEMGSELFLNKIEKVLAFVGVVTFAAVFSYGLVTQTGFLFFRTNEGKTLQAAVLIPFLFLQFYRIIKNTEQKGEWLVLFLFLCASFGMNMSSLFLHPVFLSAALLSLAISRKSVKIVRNWAFCLIPYLIIGIFYMSMRHDMFLVYVK